MKPSLPIVLGHPLLFIKTLVLLPYLHFAFRREKISPKSTALRLVKLGKCDTFPNRLLANEYAVVISAAAKVLRLSDKCCISKSVLLWCACTNKGIPVEMLVGSLVGKSDSFHAWVELGGKPLGENLSTVQRGYLPLSPPYLRAFNCE